MSISSGKFSSKILISLTILLFLIMALLMFLGLVVEKKNLSNIAELTGQKLIFSIAEEKVISRPALGIREASDEVKAEEINIDDNIEKPKITESTNQIKKLPVNNQGNTEINQSNQTIDKNEEKKIKEIKQEPTEDKRPLVAIVVGGLGLSKSATSVAINLPANITLGFSPYSYDIENLSYQALELGHELLINLPLEPMDYPADDPGPNALISEFSDEENTQRINFILSQIKSCKGAYTIDDEKFTRSITGAKNLLTTLKQANKFFLYGVGAKNTVLQQLAERMNYPLLVNDVIIDQIISAQVINQNLLKLEEAAKKNGIAIGIANPYPVTTEILEEWTKSLDKKGIKLVPLSVVHKVFLEKFYNTTNSN